MTKTFFKALKNKRNRSYPLSFTHVTPHVQTREDYQRPLLIVDYAERTESRKTR